jgi:hypothetical protein
MFYSWEERFMKRFCVVALVAFATALVAANLAQAITVDSYYRMGEGDPGAVDGAAAPVFYDSSGHGYSTVAYGGAPTYTASVCASAAAATGSSLAVDFGTSTVYVDWHAGAYQTTDNFGIEGWFMTRNPDGEYEAGADCFVHCGDALSSGYGLWVRNGTIQGLYAMVTWIDTGIAVDAEEWFYAALVRDSGNTTMYVYADDQLSVIDFGAYPAPYMPTQQVSYGIGGYNPANGCGDEIRVFTFGAGQFNSADLLINQVVPEPSSVALLAAGMVALAAYAWRKRK